MRAWTSHLQHDRAKGGITQAMQPSLKPTPTTTTPSHSPHKRGHGHSLPAHSLTHTRGPRQDKEHTTTKPMVWMACTVTMVWHKRGCGVVLPSILVQHVVAPTPSKWPRAHHTAPNNHHNTRAFWCQRTCHNKSTLIPTCVCVFDCGTVPSTMPTSVVINHCAPCQSTTDHHFHEMDAPRPSTNTSAHRKKGRGQEKSCKKITTPGVPRLSPTLVLTRPEEA